MVPKALQEADPELAREAAAALFCLCFPLFMTDAVRRTHPMTPRQFRLLMNGGYGLAPGLEEDDRRVVITSAWIDLSDEPVVICIPHTRGRHFSLTLIDTAGEPFACLGTRTGQDDGVGLALVGPHWTGEVRRGVRAIRSRSEGCWAVGRIHAHSSLDRPDAVAVAKRMFLTPMNSDPEDGQTTVTVLEPPLVSCLRQVSEMTPALLFHRLETIFERAPASFQKAHETELYDLKLKLRGPEPAATWSPALAEALKLGFTDALAEIRAAAQSEHDTRGGGWRALGAGSGEVANTTIGRAARAYAALGAPTTDERLTLTCAQDDQGRRLQGDRTYRIHFPQDALPPVAGFWRLDVRPLAPHQGRGLCSRGDLEPNADGSLDLMVQRASPDSASVGNWLPAPEGEMTLVMRLYAPEPAALSGHWRMPPVEAVNASIGRRPLRPRRRAPRTPLLRVDDPRAPSPEWKDIR